MPLSKKYFLKIAVFFTNYYSGVKLTDTHNGLRVFTINVAKKIEITQNGMSHASEFIKKIKGFKIKEVPVQIIYSNYSISKGQKLSNSFNILKDLFLGGLK